MPHYRLQRDPNDLADGRPELTELRLGHRADRSSLGIAGVRCGLTQPLLGPSPGCSLTSVPASHRKTCAVTLPLAGTRAVELDPTYAPAHAALADCYNQLGTVMVSSGSPREWRPRAAAEAIKALQLDPYSAEAHATLGYVRHYQWQWSEAEQEFRRALELNPSSSLARIWYANLLMTRRRMDEALQQVFAARDLDPFSLAVNTNVAWVLTYAGRYEEAVAQLERTLELDSTYVQAHQRLVEPLRGVGRVGEAVAAAQRVVALTQRSPFSLSRLASIHAQTGQIAQARMILGELLATADREYVPPWTFVHPYVALGDIESAVTWAEKAFEEGSNGIAYLTPDPDLAQLRVHPRIRALMTRARLE